MLRDFVAGDDPRDLHWKQSARMRHWIVREREAERDRVVFLALDNALTDPGDPAELEGLERRISRCAGQALLLLSRGASGFVSRSSIRVVRPGAAKPHPRRPGPRRRFRRGERGVPPLRPRRHAVVRRRELAPRFPLA
jgi:uncharacterized protein (DUF58 family)